MIEKAVCEALKSGMISRGSSISDIDDMLENVLNAPRRARPLRAETLQREIGRLKDENHRLTRRVAAAPTTVTPHVAQLRRSSSLSIQQSSSTPATVTNAATISSSQQGGPSSNRRRNTTSVAPISSAVSISQQLEVHTYIASAAISMYMYV
jgi:hypothetical protein